MVFWSKLKSSVVDTVPFMFEALIDCSSIIIVPVPAILEFGEVTLICVAIMLLLLLLCHTRNFKLLLSFVSKHETLGAKETLAAAAAAAVTAAAAAVTAVVAV